MARIGYAGKEYKVGRGNPVLLGATITGETMNMAIVAPSCTTCNLVFSNRSNREEKVILPIPQEYCVGDVWSIELVGFPYQEFDYYYEMDGKRVLDPYARRIVGREKWGVPLEQAKDSLYCSFLLEDFDWGQDKPLQIPYRDLVLYKMHMRGFTKHTSSGCKKQAGTYEGAIQKIPYLKELGINAVLLMPVYEFNEILVDPCYENCYAWEKEKPREVHYINIGTDAKSEYLNDSFLYNKTGPMQVQNRIPYRLNYWGYGTDNFYFAPKASYSSNPSQAEKGLKTLIRELHKASIEVVLEFSFSNDIPKKMVLDCLYYWFFEFHIDGFSLNGDVSLTGLLSNDPILSKTKLFATTWFGNECKKEFCNIAEYNDGFLVDARRFLKGDEEQVGAFSSRLRKNLKTCKTINYITNHNGFTLMDLVSYDLKHNEKNGEDNKDGTDYNYSWNCGVEGKTSRKKIRQLRIQQMKNALVMLFLSQGTPMIVMGDEFGNSQLGNNNAYCQDNAVSWLNWTQRKEYKEIEEFLRTLITMRSTYGVFSRENEFQMMDYLSCGSPDLSFHGTKAWYPDYSFYSRVFGVMYCGEYVEDCEKEKDSFYIAYNMHWIKHKFDLPSLKSTNKWEVFLCTAVDYNTNHIEKERIVEVPPRSILILKSMKR